jgi:hypothetical protein
MAKIRCHVPLEYCQRKISSDGQNALDIFFLYIYPIIFNYLVQWNKYKRNGGVGNENTLL